VFQSGQLVPELTAEENVALPLLLSGTRRGPAMTAARNWFPTLGLDGLEGLTAGGILAALGIIAATFPLLARITRPEVARNE
jgi:hypothetical protein